MWPYLLIARFRIPCWKKMVLQIPFRSLNQERFTFMSAVIYQLLWWRSLSNNMSKSKKPRTIFCSSLLFLLIVLRSELISVRSLGELTQQFNLKQKFLVSSVPRKIRFSRSMTCMVSSMHDFQDPWHAWYQANKPSQIIL